MGWRENDGLLLAPWEERAKYGLSYGPRWLSEEHMRLDVEQQVAWQSWIHEREMEGPEGEHGSRTHKIARYLSGKLHELTHKERSCEHCGAIIKLKGMKAHQRREPCQAAQNRKLFQSGFLVEADAMNPEAQKYLTSWWPRMYGPPGKRYTWGISQGSSRNPPLEVSNGSNQ